MKAKTYMRIDDPTRKRVLQCGDVFAREAGWIPVPEIKPEPAKADEPTKPAEPKKTRTRTKKK